MSFPKSCKREDFSRPRSLKYARARACSAAERVSVEPAKLSKSDNQQQEPREIATSAAHRQLYFEGFGKTTPDNVVPIEEKMSARRGAKRSETCRPAAACKGQHMKHDARRPRSYGAAS
jgi:hypothetical protein